MMSNIYRITPLQKKSVEYFVDVYQEMPDDSIRGFEVTEVWRWGQGFRELDNPVYERETDRVYCNPEDGWGCELDDLCGVYINWDDNWTDEEKADIEAYLRWEKEDDEGRCGTGWLFDGDNGLSIEEVSLYITGPVKIDIVNEEVYNEVIEENVQPEKLVHDPNAWPFVNETKD
jgi:hypothetical protein